MSLPTYDPDNVFAKILRGEIPAEKVYEDDHAMAVMDLMPQAPGHTLVIPKLAARNILDVDASALGRVIPVVQTIARAVKRAFDADGVTINQFNEPAGGQSVFHIHFHVIPRMDGVPLKRHAGGAMEDKAVLAANAEKIRKALG